MTIRIKDTTSALAYLDEQKETYPGDLHGDAFIVHYACVRCGGSGIYSHFHGNCWKCNGSGGRGVKQVSVVRFARNLRQKKTEQSRKARARRVERVANFCSFFRARRDLISVFRCEHSIVKEMLHKIARFGDLSDRQVALARKLHDEASATLEEVAKTSVPDNTRAEFTGCVVSTKERLTAYGLQYKMLVEVETSEGSFRVWGTIPGSILDQVEKGCSVTLTATLKRSENDDSFGFFSRPAKATVVSP